MAKLIAPIGRFVTDMVKPKHDALGEFLVQSIENELKVENQVPADLKIAERIYRDECEKFDHMVSERARLQNEIVHRQGILAQLEVLIDSTSVHLRQIESIIPEDR